MMAALTSQEILYFAYGANMDAEVMKSRMAPSSGRRHATLEGFALKFNKVPGSPQNKGQKGYANITEAAGEKVEGILYQITQAGLKSLDEQEGYPTHYDRITVNAVLPGGGKATALAYTAQPDFVRDGLLPTRAYRGF